MLRAIVARPCWLQRAATLLVAVAIASQAMFAGLAAAQTTVLGGLGGELAVICHGNGADAFAGDQDRGAPPDPLDAAHGCCLACLSGAAPATLTPPFIVPRSASWRIVQTFAANVAAAPAARRAVRDGPSQAPPILTWM